MPAQSLGTTHQQLVSMVVNRRLDDSQTHQLESIGLLIGYVPMVGQEELLVLYVMRDIKIYPSILDIAEIIGSAYKRDLLLRYPFAVA